MGHDKAEQMPIDAAGAGGSRAAIRTGETGNHQKIGDGTNCGNAGKQYEYYRV